MVIFSRSYDLLTWLLPHCERFPATQRFVVTKRLQDAALDFQEAIFLGQRARGPAAARRTCRTADAHLNKLRLYLRLAHQWEWLSAGQYEHVSKMVAEVGRLLGGWIKQTRGG